MRVRLVRASKGLSANRQNAAQRGAVQHFLYLCSKEVSRLNNLQSSQVGILHLPPAHRSHKNGDMQPNRAEAYLALAVTPSDSADVSALAKSLPCGFMVVTTAGDVAVTTSNGASITFKSVALNSVIPVEISRVLATGTTAVGVVALYRRTT